MQFRQILLSLLIAVLDWYFHHSPEPVAAPRYDTKGCSRPPAFNSESPGRGRAGGSCGLPAKPPSSTAGRKTASAAVLRGRTPRKDGNAGRTKPPAGNHRNNGASKKTAASRGKQNCFDWNSALWPDHTGSNTHLPAVFSAKRPAMAHVGAAQPVSLPMQTGF